MNTPQERKQRKGRRKRERTEAFNLNRSTPVVKEKYLRSHTRQIEMDGINNLNQVSNDLDMASATNSVPLQGAIPKISRQNTPHPIETIRDMNCEDLGPGVRQMVQDSVNHLQQRIEGAIQQRVDMEMSRVSDAIKNLNEAVRLLSLNRENDVNVSSNGTACRAEQRQQQNVVQPQQNSAPRSYNVPQQNHDLHYPIPPPHSITQPNLEDPRLWQRPPNMMPHLDQVEARASRVEKFGLVFDGNQKRMSVDDFVFRIQYLQRQYKIPDSEMLRDFHLLVKGSALDWFWLQVKTNQVTSWDALTHSLISHYQTPSSYLEIMRDLVERKQQSGESIDDYFHSINRLRSKLEHPITEYEMIRIAKLNLKESLSKMMFSVTVSSVEQLRVQCLEAERLFFRREVKPIQGPTRVQRYANEVHYDQDENDDCAESPDNHEVEAVSGLICWNCREPGHTFMECKATEWNRFCYRCGKPDVITPQCPKCKSGNPRRNAGNPGDQRSGMNPAK